MTFSPALVHIDVSELVANPLRSGIQRVEREAIRHWPGPATLVPIRVNADGKLRVLSKAVFDVLCAEDDGSPESRDTERETLSEFMLADQPPRHDAIDRLLNLELFFDGVRADAHIAMARSGVCVLWYVYDFLPFLNPELFPPGSTRHCMHFLRALKGIGKRLAFLSSQTRTDYAKRIARLSSIPVCWPVINPGADGLRLERQAFSPDRLDFISIGTIEPRKNPNALLRAFELLWKRGCNAHLVVAGRISPAADEAVAFFARYAGDSRLKVLGPASDAALRGALRGARAVVMASEAERFALPPYEALQAGIPAIASRSLPSAEMMPQGTVLLQRMEAEAIADAVEMLLDDGAAARLWSAAATVRLPTWASFGRALGEWAQRA